MFCKKYTIYSIIFITESQVEVEMKEVSDLKVVLFLQLLVLVIFVFSMYLLPSNLYFISILSIFVIVNTIGLSYYVLRILTENMKEKGIKLRWLYFTIMVVISLVTFSYLLSNIFKIWLKNYPESAILDFLNTLLIVLTLLLVSFGISYLTLKRELERQISENKRLEELKLKFQLESLKSKVNPHFLFNTIATALSMIEIDEDKDKIKNYLLEVGNLLRKSVDAPETWTINEEIELTKSYLSINKTRLGEKLDFEIFVADECLYKKIPALILQPVVENAVVHGISKSKKGGKIYISCTTINGQIVITVKDTGIGADKIVKGTGINLVEERLKLFSKNSTMEIVSKQNEGTTVKMIIKD
ncbi:signal transduction histidine kinase, LytS [Fervidobacterium nodosum Rt17-B1]|uniref:Signal transduction histidine kinase, LytS n=1 Tax=Fervidobacterium nodosum (strain ATCC 35602 / DSM 5306 / Rt17-B1) TaxID=381764 RepID=A7HMG1_FERNB|nr:signal transduction histidine kinase, LytS [Fervidobacterium nodosum Rt17-B1]KAF2962381.1 histidine kinase [Fervidobacterium sp. 2310opik-2]